MGHGDDEDEDLDLDLVDDDLEDVDAPSTKSGRKGRFGNRSTSRSRSPPPKSSSSSSRFRRTSVATKADMSASSGSNTGGAGGASLWQSRDKEVDQSVNLMDQTSEQDVFVSGRSRGPGSMATSATRQKSMVDVFLTDGPQSRTASSGDIFVDSRRQRRKKQIRLACCAAIGMVAVIVVLVAVPSFGWVHNMRQKAVKNNNNPAKEEAPKVEETLAPTRPKHQDEEEKEVIPEEDVTVPESARPQAAGASLSGGQADLDVEDAPQSSRMEALLGFVTDQDVSEQSALQQEGSATQKAMQWVSQEDPAKLEIPGMDASKESNQQAEHSLLQRYALAVFYFSMTAASSSNQEGDAGRLRHLRRQLQQVPPPTEGELSNRKKFDNEWLSASHICQWHGVVCQKDGENVKEVNLASHLLQGTVPRELLDGGAMPYLKILDLDNNQLQGSLPKVDIERQMAGAQSGAAPSKPTLTTLKLSRNDLTGYLDNLMAMTDLQVINLEGNRFEGPLPDEIVDLSNLEELILNDNQLSGNLPGESLGELTLLRVLDVGDNGLNEQLPEMLYTMTNLQTLDVSGNQLTGYIPDDIGDLTNLVELALDKNQFTGQIPITFHKLKKLRRLLMDGNELTGTVSPEVCGLTNTTLKEFEADCAADGKITCTCCSHCF